MFRKVSLLILVLILIPLFSFAETIDVQIKGVDDGVKTSIQRDYKEAVLFAKREAIERAGVKVKSESKMEDFVLYEDYIESQAEAVLLAGYQIIDMGYSVNGTYQVVLVGKVRVLSSVVGDDIKKDITKSPDELYSSAKTLFNMADFKNAREEFEILVKKYPNSEYADDAQFWIGETYYREKWYEKAILEYQKVIEEYPHSIKMQACLLKQGFAFFNLGDKANTQIILNELIAKFPKSKESDIARKKLKSIK